MRVKITIYFVYVTTATFNILSTWLHTQTQQAIHNYITRVAVNIRLTHKLHTPPLPFSFSPELQILDFIIVLSIYEVYLQTREFVVS